MQDAIEAVEAQIPSIDGLATEDYVDNAVNGLATETYVDNAVAEKQDELESGVNIKTINNQSILGEGNITVEGGSGTSDYEQLTNKPAIDGNELSADSTSEELGLASKEYVDNLLRPDVNLLSIGTLLLGSFNLGTHLWGESTSAYSYYVPVIEGTKIRLKANGYSSGNWTVRYCFLTDTTWNYQAGDLANLVEGTTIFQEKAPNKEYEITVPEGAKLFYMLFGATNATYEYNYKPAYCIGKGEIDIDADKYSTINVDWVDGNAFNTTAMNKAGVFLALSKAPSSIALAMHTRLYRVKPDTDVTITLAKSGEGNIKTVFLDKNYLTTKSSLEVVLPAGSTTVTFKIPTGTEYMSLMYACIAPRTDLDMPSGPRATMTYVRNEVKPNGFYPRPADGYQGICVRIALTDMFSNQTELATDTYSGTTYGYDNGILCLPENYDPNGEPVKLICFTHGHAVNYSNTSTAFDSNDVKPAYWLSEGYAIFDMDGSVQGTFSGNHDYESAAVLAYDAAYKFITTHYNVRTDGVYTTGRSMGGGTQFLLAKRSNMPIKASCPMVPSTRPLGYVDGVMTGAQRKELLATYGVPQDELDAVTWTSASTPYYQLTQAERDLIVANQFRFTALIPCFCYNRPLTDTELCNYSEGYATKDTSKLELFYNSVKDSINTAIYRGVPFHMYACVTDPSVWFEGPKLMNKILSNAGHLSQIHVFPTPEDRSITDHRFEINPDNLVTYTNSKGVELQNVPKVYIETLAFWKRFDQARP